MGCDAGGMVGFWLDGRQNEEGGNGCYRCVHHPFVGVHILVKVACIVSHGLLWLELLFNSTCSILCLTLCVGTYLKDSMTLLCAAALKTFCSLDSVGGLLPYHKTLSHIAKLVGTHLLNL